MSQDTRPEVRNSGVRTLFAVVVNQGPRLSRALWEQCLWEMLFPLLRHAYLMSATASRDEVGRHRQRGWASAVALVAVGRRHAVMPHLLGGFCVWHELPLLTADPHYAAPRCH